MIMNAFPRTQGTLSQESYLTLLLLALVDQAGGELRISAQALEKLDSGGKILVDWDTINQQCVIRAGTPGLVVAEVRGSGWTKSPQPPAQAPASQDPAKHHIMTEEKIIERAAQMLRNDQLRQWREQGAAAVATMPPPE
jgi:hypothetical protein